MSSNNLITFILFVLINLNCFILRIDALKCYQNEQTNNQSVVGSPLDCPQGSLSCSKMVEPLKTVRSCQTTNCTV